MGCVCLDCKRRSSLETALQRLTETACLLHRYSMYSELCATQAYLDLPRTNDSFFEMKTKNKASINQNFVSFVRNQIPFEILCRHVASSV